MNKFKKGLALIAKQYSNPKEFEQNNFAKYTIAKSKGYLREFFPDYVFEKPVYTHHLDVDITITENKILKDRLEDYIIILRQRKYNHEKNGSVSKQFTSTMINELTDLFKDIK